MRPLRRRERDAILIRKPQNEYYERLSERFGIAQVMLYLALLAFVVLSFLANTNLITYQNLYHFVKDLNHSIEAVDVMDSDILVYPSAEEQSFALYRNGLAVAGDSSIHIFTATGRQTLTQPLTYRMPIAVGRGKYLLVYDLGGTDYALYNSYTQIHSGKTSYPITYATVSDAGTYVVVSASDQANSMAELFNSDFQLLNRFSSQNGYYSAICIDDESRQVALFSSKADTTAFSTTLTVCEIGAAEPIYSGQVSDAIALDATFTSGGEIAVLCTDRLLYCRTNGNRVLDHRFEQGRLLSYDLSIDGVTLCLSHQTGIRETQSVYAFDPDGALLFSQDSLEGICAVARSGMTLFLQEQGSVRAVHVKKQTEQRLPAPTDGIRMLAVSEDEVLCCTPKKAVYLQF